MYSHIGSNKDYRSQKTPIKVDKNTIVSNYQRAINQSNYQNIYQASLINKEKHQQQKKNLLSPTKGANSNKLFKTTKNNELVIQYNFNNSKDKEDSNERYFESNDYQDNHVQIISNEKVNECQNKLQFFSPQHQGCNSNDFFDSPEKDSSSLKNKQIPNNQEAPRITNLNNYTMNDDESKLQIKELIDMCPDIKNNENLNLNETLSFIQNRSSLNNSNINPTLSNLFVSQKFVNENIDFHNKKNNFDVALDSFRKKNGKLTENKQIVNNVQENNFFLKNSQNNTKNQQNLSKVTTKLPQYNNPIAQINLNEIDNFKNKLDEKDDKQKIADISNYNILNNLLISNQSMNVNIQKDKNEYVTKIDIESEQDKEKEKIEDKPNNVEVINMPSKKDSISNYNSLARNFIFSYEEDNLKEYLQEAKESNTLFSIQNMEENKIENKRMVNSNSFVGEFYNNDDNKSIYFNKLEHQIPLNNSHDAISNSTHLFPVFEKNLDFEIESPTNYDKNKNAYDTNDSTSQETKFHNRNMEISKIISNNLHEDNQVPKLNFNYIKQGNEDQDNKDEEKLTTRNMVKSYANFYKNNVNYVNSEQENNEDFAKRINFFSNDNNLDLSVEETEIKGSEVNSPEVNLFVSPPFNFNEEKVNNKLVPLDKFNFFESTDLMRSVNIRSTNDEIKTPDKFEHVNEINKENKQNDNANTKFNLQPSQLSELVLFSPQNRNNIVTPNYVNKFINTTTSKTKTRLTSEIPKFNEEKEPFIPSSTPNILNKNLNNGQINHNFQKNNKPKTNLNKSDLMIENTEKIVFESVKKSGSPQRISSKINLDIFSDNKPIELEPKMAESNKVLPSATLQPQILTVNRPKIINEEKIDNMVIKLSSKNSMISLHNQNNMNSYCNNGSMLKIHSRKHILSNCKQNSFNVQNESGSGNNVNSAHLNRKESKKYSVGINEKHELKNKEKAGTQNKKSRQMDRPIVPTHKLIQNTNKKNNINNEIFSPSSKGIRPSNVISTNSQVFSPNSNYGNNHIEFKTEKNSISDLLSPTSNVDNISYISKFNLDTSKNNNSSISRTINTESSNKMSKKANDSTQNLDPKNPNFSSKKSILEDKVKFDSII